MYDIDILAGSQSIPYSVCKTLVFEELIDTAATHYFQSDDGSRKIEQAVFREDLECDFHIARDTAYPTYMALSEKFVEVCLQAKLKIDFLPLKQR